jgi:transposase-like protein
MVDIEAMRRCPNCQSTERQVKAGRTEAGSQRYKCQQCQRRYTPDPKAAGYGEGLRQQAVRLKVEGTNLRRIARHLRVNHQTVINWVNAHVATLPDESPLPASVTVVEQDELFTFIGDKKPGLCRDVRGARHPLHCRLGRHLRLRR